MDLWKLMVLFLSTPPLGRRRALDLLRGRPRRISIRTHLMEGDEGVEPAWGHILPMSIHALLAESDDTSYHSVRDEQQFLSTPSSRRATPACPIVWRNRLAFLSTPPSRRAARTLRINRQLLVISIHMLSIWNSVPPAEHERVY